MKTRAKIHRLISLHDRAMATLSQFRHRSPSPVYGRGRSRPPCLNVLDADGDNTPQERKNAAPPILEFFETKCK